MGLSIPSLVLRDLVDFDLPRGSPIEPAERWTSGGAVGVLEVTKVFKGHKKNIHGNLPFWCLFLVGCLVIVCIDIRYLFSERPLSHHAVNTYTFITLQTRLLATLSMTRIIVLSSTRSCLEPQSKAVWHCLFSILNRYGGYFPFEKA